MKLYLARHAKAEPRKDWEGDDVLRPLSRAGREQAEALAAQLASVPLARVVTGSSLRCQQSVEPLVRRRGVPVEVDERLDRGESVQRTLELMPAYGEGPVLYCTHVDVVCSLLRLFELVEPDKNDQIPCRKGSVWVIEGPGYTPTTAEYLEPHVGPDEVRATESQRVERPRSVRAAALDLGSTSFNLLIADVAETGELRPVVREKVMLRLGSVIASNEVIPDYVCARAVEVARELRIVAEHEKVQRLFPVATSALREARNGDALADRIGLALGTPVRILSGREEARFIFRALQQGVSLGGEPTLGVDLGGGSLELAVGSCDGVEVEVTLPLGVARLHRACVRRDPMRKAEQRAVRDRVRELLAPHGEALRARGIVQTLATGGTARGLARLVHERRAGRGPRAGWPLPLPLETLRSLTKELVASTHEERLEMRGMRKDRADLLPTGGVVLTTLAEELGIEHFLVSDWGLREGVLLDALAAEWSA